MAWTLRSGERARRRGAPAAPVEPATPVAAPARRQPLADLVDALAGATLVLVAEPESLDALPAGVTQGGARVVRLWQHDLPARWPEDVEPDWQSVLLVTLDRATLRRLASELPDPGPVTDVALWLAGARQPVAIAPRPGWTPLRRLEAVTVPRPDRGAFTSLSFVRAVRSRPVLQELALQSVPSSRHDRSGLMTGYVGRRPAPGLDLGSQHFTTVADSVDLDLVVPPDVVVTVPGQVPDLAPHHVTDRAPVVVTDPGLEPVDELVFTPRGWRRVPEKGDVDLVDLAGPGGVTEMTVRRSRVHRAVRLPAATEAADLLKLTVAGVPVLVDDPDPRLAPQLRALLADVPDLDDTLQRDAWSVKLRRASFDHHSTSAWRAGLVTRAGLDRLAAGPAGLPGVSVLLATKREHELEGAVARVAAQVNAEVELVVATHGFTADRARLTEILGREPVLVPADADTLFGDVLSAAARAASHDVVMKMDDDDWYSPHTVHDLLMARRYSGADVVGSPAEFVHLAEDDETLRRINPAECSTSFVAGGTMMLSKDLLREVGWFRPVRRWVDAQLLAMVTAGGGSIYRTHGLNYVLRRHTHGHTWSGDPDNFRAPGTVDRTWPGFRPPEEGV